MSINLCELNIFRFFNYYFNFCFSFLSRMCDLIGISGMYDFICPYSIAYVSDASAALKEKKTVFIAKTMEGCQRVCLYFAPLNTGKYSSFIIKFNCYFNLTSY